MERAAEILQMVAAYSGLRPGQVDQADIFGAGKLAGDDADEFLGALIHTYGIDFTEFRGYLHYDGNEPPGSFPRSWGVGTDGKRLAMIPISMSDLLRTAESGKWQIEYPEHRRVERGWLYFMILLLVVCPILILIAFLVAWHLPL